MGLLTLEFLIIIYILDLYSEKTVSTYSLESNTIIDMLLSTINNERYKYYKRYFPNYPYEYIDHIYNNNFYQIINYGNNKDKVLVQYDPIDKTDRTYNIERFHDKTDRKVGQFYLDLINNHWFLFSSKGVFMFDHDFSNERQLLNEKIFEENKLS